MVIGSPTVLNLIPGGVMKMVHVNQTDKNMDIQFQIMNGNQPFNVPEGWTGTIRGTKGDAFGYAAAVTVTAGSNLVTAHLKEQLTAVAGVGNVFELVFASTSAKVSTENFILAVEKSALNDETVISESDLVYANQVLNQLQSVAAVNQQVQQNKANIATETAARAAADTTLQNNINTEAAARQAADQTLQSNINAEASTRATADASLQSQIDQLVAPSGEAPSAAEVLNARIGADGVTYPTLGDAIRTNDSELKSQIVDLTDAEVLPVEPLKYVDGSGSTVTMVNGYPSASVIQNYNLSIVPCQFGDVFTINVTGGVSARGYIFIDSVGTILDKCGESKTFSDFELIAPPRSAFLILNNNISNQGNSYKGRLLYKAVDNIVDDTYKFTGNERLINTHRLYYVNASGSTVTMDNGYPAILHDNNTEVTIEACQAGDVFTINALGGITSRAYAFINSAGTILDRTGENANLTNYVVTAPENSAFLIINNKDFSSGRQNYKGKYLVNATVEEIENALVGADGAVYDSLGNAIRGQITDVDNSIKSISPKPQLLKQYLYKQNTFIHTNAEEALASYDLFKIPVSYGDVVFIKQVSGNTVFWNTLINSYVFSLLYANATYANITSGSTDGIGGYGIDGKSGLFQIPQNVTHLMVSSYRDYENLVEVQINSPLVSFNEGAVSRYETVIDINSETAFESKFYKALLDPPRFSALSGEYLSHTLKIHAGDKITFSGLVGSITSYATFSTANNVTTGVNTPSFTAPSDGMINIFAHPSYPQTQTLFPAKSIKIDYSDVMNTPEISNEYSGLTGVAFGTSLTYRAKTTGGYLQYLPTLSGITFDNQGVGSSVIKANGTQPNMMTTIINYSGYSGKRVCILEGFVNDWYYNGDVLGTWKDTGTASVCGCVRTALTHILTQNPNLTVFLVLDPYGKGITASNAVNGAGDTQLEFYEEVAKVAESMGVTVIKEYAISGISELTPQYLMDNIHPTALGAEQSARAIWSGMKGTYPNLTA